jgi:hypothetical protein
LFWTVRAQNIADRFLIKADKNLIRTGELLFDAAAAEFLHFIASLSFQVIIPVSCAVYSKNNIAT